MTEAPLTATALSAAVTQQQGVPAARHRFYVDADLSVPLSAAALASLAHGATLHFREASADPDEPRDLEDPAAAQPAAAEVRAPTLGVAEREATRVTVDRATADGASPRAIYAPVRALISLRLLSLLMPLSSVWHFFGAFLQYAMVGYGAVAVDAALAPVLAPVNVALVRQAYR